MGLSRFLQKLRLKGGSPRPASPNRAAAGPADTPRPAAAPAPSSSSLQERLWNQAYDGLRVDEPKIVEAYEKFLSTELQDDGGNSLAANDDSQHTERGRQLEQLIQIGLRRTEKVAAVKEKIEDGLQTVNIVKGLVSSAVQAAPAAAVAWVGVCFSLEVLTNSLAEAQANRKGLAYVVSRMDWYWNLVGLLLDRDAHIEMHGLRGQLEEHILKLYGKLLLYQIKSICLYHQNQGVVFLKDMVKLDDWRGQVDEIKEAEAAVQRDSQQYNSQRACTQLRDLVATADRQRTELLAIVSAVQDQMSQQGRIYQDEKDTQCLHRLCITDPRTDKARIQSTKGGLLRDSYAWILGNPDFKQWQTHPDRGLLWIKGDPGKGKTMLLCGIIDELKQQSAGQPAYFFCQATDQNLNNATAVLRGLIFFLVCQQPQLISYVRKEYDAVGQKLFEGSNIWEAMSKILTAMLGDPALRGTIMVVDALDECGRDRSKLLKLIVDLSASHHVKWLVSSRNQPDIEEELGTAGQKVTLHLELNEDVISVAVKSYIQHKVHELARRKGYDETTRAKVQKHFADKADNTFLWVALVYEELARENVRAWHATDILKWLPSGLNELYERMMGYIQTLRDAELCKQILAAASVVYRPLLMRELAAIVKLPAYFNDHPEALNILIGSCGSFLTLRDDVIYFVHQSAKDFLLNKASSQILPRGITYQHRDIFLSSIKILSLTLRRNIYGLASPGSSIDNISPPDPDPLAHVRYSCLYWVDHLKAAKPTDKATLGHLNSATYTFLQQTYLYWLEALSLQRSISQAVLAVQELQAMVAAAGSQRLAELVHDAHRFVLSYKAAIEIAPLQLYASALVFSPTRSTVRNLFKHDEPDWVLLPPLIQPDWNACVQTLECNGVSSVALKYDGTQLASGSLRGDVKIWDVATGQCLKTLEGHGDSGAVLSVAFTADSKWLAAGLGRRSLSESNNGTVQIWNIATDQCVQELEGHSKVVRSVAFTADGKQLASGSDDKTVKIWDVTTEHVGGTSRCVKTLEGHSFPINSVAFTANGMLASGSYDRTVRIWDVASGQCALTIDGPDRKDYPAAGIRSVAFTADGKQLALASDDHTIKIWDMARGKYVQILVGHRSHVASVAFTGDGIWLASGSYDNTIKIWDVDKGQCVQTLEGHSNAVHSVAFRANSTCLTSGLTWRLISGSSDDTIKIWDAAVGHDIQKPDGHGGWVGPVTLVADGTRLASGSTGDSTVKIWNTATGECVQTLEGHDRNNLKLGRVESLAFTADGKQLASGSFNTTKIWDTATGECIQTLEDHARHQHRLNSINSLAFTADGKQLASGSSHNIKIWDVTIGACVQILKGHDHIVNTLAFTADGTRLASGSYDYTVKIWDADTCVQTLKGHRRMVNSVTFTADGTRLASGSSDGSIKIWDVATGACMETVSVGASVHYLSFDPHTNATLLSEFGTLAFDPSACHAQLQEASPMQPTYHGWGISPDGAWIVKDGQRVLWLPSEYRPWRTVVRGSCVALGCFSGRVIIFKFSTKMLNL